MAVCPNAGCWFTFVLHLIFLVMIIYVLIKLILDYKHRLNSQPRVSTKAGTVAFWTSLCYIVSTLLYQFQRCVDYVDTLSNDCIESYLLERISNGLYALQVYTLWIVLFARIYVVFVGSAYKLSPCTIKWVIAFFCTTPLLVLFAYVAIWDTVVMALIGLMFLCSVAFCIWITAFFVYKLLQVVKGARHIDGKSKTHDQLLATITKNTLLATISMASTLAAVAVWVIYYFAVHSSSTWKNPDAAYYVYEYAFLLDVATNFCSVSLAHRLFSAHYRSFCKCCDKKCRVCCDMLMKKQTIEIPATNSSGALETVHSVQSVDSAVDTVL